MTNEDEPLNPYAPSGSDVVVDAPAPVVQGLANKSLALGIVGLFCCGMVCGPLAISYANRAEAAVIHTGGGEQYMSRAKVGRTLGYIAVVLWVLGLFVRMAARG